MASRNNDKLAKIYRKKFKRKICTTNKEKNKWKTSYINSRFHVQYELLCPNWIQFGSAMNFVLFMCLRVLFTGGDLYSCTRVDAFHRRSNVVFRVSFNFFAFEKDDRIESIASGRFFFCFNNFFFGSIIKCLVRFHTRQSFRFSF